MVFSCEDMALMVRILGLVISHGKVTQDFERLYSYVLTYFWKKRREYNDFNVWKYRFFSDYFWLHEECLKELNFRVMTLSSMDVK